MRLRSRVSSALPSGVTVTIEQRPSVGSAARVTRPSSARRARIRVAVGRWIRSALASSLGVSGPSALDGRQRGDRGGAELGAGLLAHPPGGAGDRESQPRGALGEVGCGCVLAS